MGIFQSPYYSSLTLIPVLDPYPFTFANLPQSRRYQPNVTLDQFTLPDGTWQWLSKCWMIDMTAYESGKLQPDGFEYNWIFRTKGWKSAPGHFGFVRRRRWMRLMVRHHGNHAQESTILTPRAVLPPAIPSAFTHRPQAQLSIPGQFRDALSKPTN